MVSFRNFKLMMVNPIKQKMLQHHKCNNCVQNLLFQVGDTSGQEKNDSQEFQTILQNQEASINQETTPVENQNIQILTSQDQGYQQDEKQKLDNPQFELEQQNDLKTQGNESAFKNQDSQIECQQNVIKSYQETSSKSLIDENIQVTQEVHNEQVEFNDFKEVKPLEILNTIEQTQIKDSSYTTFQQDSTQLLAQNQLDLHGGSHNSEELLPNQKEILSPLNPSLVTNSQNLIQNNYGTKLDFIVTNSYDNNFQSTSTQILSSDTILEIQSDQSKQEGNQSKQEGNQSLFIDCGSQLMMAQDLIEESNQKNTNYSQQVIRIPNTTDQHQTTESSPQIQDEFKQVTQTNEINLPNIQQYEQDKDEEDENFDDFEEAITIEKSDSLEQMKKQEEDSSQQQEREPGDVDQQKEVVNSNAQIEPQINIPTTKDVSVKNLDDEFEEFEEFKDVGQTSNQQQKQNNEEIDEFEESQDFFQTSNQQQQLNYEEIDEFEESQDVVQTSNQQQQLNNEEIDEFEEFQDVGQTSNQQQQLNNEEINEFEEFPDLAKNSNEQQLNNEEIDEFEEFQDVGQNSNQQQQQNNEEIDEFDDFTEADQQIINDNPIKQEQLHDKDDENIYNLNAKSKDYISNIFSGMAPKAQKQINKFSMEDQTLIRSKVQEYEQKFILNMQGSFIQDQNNSGLISSHFETWLNYIPRKRLMQHLDLPEIEIKLQNTPTHHSDRRTNDTSPTPQKGSQLQFTFTDAIQQDVENQDQETPKSSIKTKQLPNTKLSFESTPSITNAKVPEEKNTPLQKFLNDLPNYTYLFENCQPVK